MTRSKDTMIKPFGNLYHPERYHGAGEPCVVCRKPIKDAQTKAHWLMVYEGTDGNVFTDKENESDPWFRGGFPVGSECWRKIQAERRVIRSRVGTAGERR